MARIILIGDSHVAGICPSFRSTLAELGHSIECQSFPGRKLASLTEEIVFSIAAGGQSTRFRDSVVVFVGGGNDASAYCKNAGRARLLAQNVAGAARELMKVGALPVFVGVFPSARQELNECRSFVSRTILEAASRVGAKIINPHSFAQTGHGPDAVHYTSTAYAAIGERLAQLVQTLIEREIDRNLPKDDQSTSNGANSSDEPPPEPKVPIEQGDSVVSLPPRKREASPFLMGALILLSAGSAFALYKVAQAK